VWFEGPCPDPSPALETGLLPAGAGTDAMTNFASLRGPLGTDRVFVRSPVPLDHSRWLAALKAGKSMATNGPLVSLKANGVAVGQEVKLPAGGGEVRFEVWLRSYVPVDHLQLIGNGEVVADLPLSGDHTAKEQRADLDDFWHGCSFCRAAPLMNAG